MLLTLGSTARPSDAARFATITTYLLSCGVVTFVRTLTGTRMVRPAAHLLPRFGALWDRALPAAVLEARLVRPSRRTFEAAFPARTLVFLDLATMSSPLVEPVHLSVRPAGVSVNHSV